MYIKGAALSDRGKVRQSNEDAFIADVKTAVFLVADGMGGHAAGEIASRIAALTTAETLAERDLSLDLTQQLRAAVRCANARVYDMQEKVPEYRGMGSTLTVLMFDADRYHLAQVGDSRAYLLRGGELRQLSHDHSIVWPLYMNGKITKDGIAKHPEKHLVTRCVGARPEVEADLFSDVVQDGDIYMLCSDGLTDVVTDGKVRHILTKSGRHPKRACKELLRAANACGGPDNITAVVAAVKTNNLQRQRPLHFRITSALRLSRPPR